MRLGCVLKLHWKLLAESSLTENSIQTATLRFVDVISNIDGQIDLWIDMKFISLMKFIEISYPLIIYHIYLVGTSAKKKQQCHLKLEHYFYNIHFIFSQHKYYNRLHYIVKNSSIYE